MEKTSLGTVLPLDAGWNDIGSWSALWESSNRDKKNFLIGLYSTQKQLGQLHI